MHIPPIIGVSSAMLRSITDPSIEKENAKECFCTKCKRVTEHEFISENKLKCKTCGIEKEYE